MTRRQFLGGSAAMLLGASGLGTYARFFEPHWVEVVERPLPVKDLPSALDGAKLVHLADLHVGPYVSDDYILSVFERVSGLSPDIVVFTGDLTAYHPGVIQQAVAVYQHTPHGRLATIATLGNHDYGRDWSDDDHADKVADAIESQGVRVLRNQIEEVEGLSIVGLDDLWAGRFKPAETFRKLKKGSPAIALSHNPDSADWSDWSGFSGWILAGHTHGGQVKPPFFDPPRLPVHNRRYSAGEIALTGDRRMYINRGIGHLRNQVRFNARPEITLFTLRPT